MPSKKVKKQLHTAQEIFKVTPRFQAQLQQAANTKGVSKSLICRTAVEAWLDRNMPGWRS